MTFNLFILFFLMCCMEQVVVEKSVTYRVQNGLTKHNLILNLQTTYFYIFYCCFLKFLSAFSFKLLRLLLIVFTVHSKIYIDILYRFLLAEKFGCFIYSFAFLHFLKNVLRFLKMSFDCFAF